MRLLRFARNDVKRLLVIGFFTLAVPVQAKEVPPPVIFIHGLGDSSFIWRVAGPKVSASYEAFYKTDRHPYFLAGSGIGSSKTDRDFSDNPRDSCVYATFRDRFAKPDDQVEELRVIIEETRREVAPFFPQAFPQSEKVRVDLVVFSMGGLVARSYLTRYPIDHHVRKLVMLSTPNRGSDVLYLNWVPRVSFLGGLAGALLTGGNPLFVGVGFGGFLIDLVSYTSGVSTMSPGAWSMRPDSPFLKDLNLYPHPTDVEYISILSDTTEFRHQLAGQLFGHQGGDGAVSLHSQRFSEAGVPNFSELRYREYLIHAPHFIAPNYAVKEILSALGY